MVTGTKIAEDALQILSAKWGYIYGTAGIMWTEARQSDLEKRHTGQTKYEQSVKYGSKWIGHKVADCSGLVKYILEKYGIKAAHGSNSQWAGSLSQKGLAYDGIPVGALVFKARGSDFYHVGIYVGDGYVVEAQGTRTGVIRSKLSSWGYYGLVKGVTYSEEVEEVPVMGKAIVDVPNDGTLNVRTRPESNSKVLCTVREGSTLEVLENGGTWAKVRFPAEGYVMTKFLRAVKTDVG